MGTMAHGEVEVDDAKLIGEAFHQWEQTGREAVNARKGIHIQRFAMLRKPCTTYIFVRTLHLARLDILPTHESHGIVEEQVALGLALADQQDGIFVSLMLTGKPTVVYIVEDVDIMQQDRRLVTEQRLGLLQSTTGLQQLVGLVTETNQRGIVLPSDIVDNLLSKMVDIDDEAVVALRLQLADVPLQQGLATYRHQCLGHRVSQGLQSGAQSCSENHGLLHTAGSVWVIPCSRWQMRTSIPNFSWICSAKCWAE